MARAVIDRVVSSTKTVPGSAVDCTRAAVLTTSTNSSDTNRRSATGWVGVGAADPGGAGEAANGAPHSPQKRLPASAAPHRGQTALSEAPQESQNFRWSALSAAHAGQRMGPS